MSRRYENSKIPAEFLIWFVPSAALIGIVYRAGGPLPDWFFSVGLWVLAGLAVLAGIGMAVREIGRGNAEGRLGNRPGPRIESDHYDPVA